MRKGATFFLCLLSIIALLMVFMEWRGTSGGRPKIGGQLPISHLYSIEGNEVEFPITNSPKIVFYLSEHCRPCINHLSDISSAILKTNKNNVECYIIWENGIPVSAITMNEISKDINYSLRGSSILSNTTPVGYILDQNNYLTFISTDLSELLTKVSRL